MTQKPEEERTRKQGRVSLHPLKFEDALWGLLETKPKQAAVEANNLQMHQGMEEKKERTNE